MLCDVVCKPCKSTHRYHRSSVTVENGTCHTWFRPRVCHQWNSKLPANISGGSLAVAAMQVSAEKESTVRPMSSRACGHCSCRWAVAENVQARDEM